MALLLILSLTRHFASFFFLAWAIASVITSVVAERRRLPSVPLENQLEILGPGRTDLGSKNLRGGCAGLYRYRDGGPGRCELDRGPLSRRIRICDRNFAGADRVA